MYTFRRRSVYMALLVIPYLKSLKESSVLDDYNMRYPIHLIRRHENLENILMIILRVTKDASPYD